MHCWSGLVVAVVVVVAAAAAAVVVSVHWLAGADLQRWIRPLTSVRDHSTRYCTTSVTVSRKPVTVKLRWLFTAVCTGG